jgi:acetyl esterase/lipase
LALALAWRLKQLGEAPPAGLLLLSPVTDPTLSGASFERNARIDPMLRRGWVEQGLRWYGAAVDEPLHHPLQQDLAGLPPMLIQVGDREILLSDASRLAEHAARCGVPCRLEIHAGRWHVFQLQAFYLPSIGRAIRTLGQFARERFTATPD